METGQKALCLCRVEGLLQAGLWMEDVGYITSWLDQLRKSLPKTDSTRVK